MIGIYPAFTGASSHSVYPMWTDPIDGDFVIVDKTNRGGSGSRKNSFPTDERLVRARREDADLLAVVMCAIRVIQ